MVRNGNNGKGPTTLEIPDNPYVARIDNGAGEPKADEQTRGAAADEPDLPPPDLPRIDAGGERKRRGRPLFFCVAALGLICAGLGLYVWYGGHARVSYQIAERKNLRS